MQKVFSLPLYNDFMKVFDNNRIISWRAKNFWNAMEINPCFDKNKIRRQMYAGLKILVICEYLKIDTSRSSKKVFVYSETERLEELRNKYKNEKLNVIFSDKKKALLDEIEEKEANINFINNLLSADKSLERYFIEIKEILEKGIKKFKAHIKLMDDII